MVLADVLDRLKSECRRAGSQKAWAQAHGVSIPYVNDVFNGAREPGPAILAGLKVRKVVTYEDEPLPDERRDAA